MASFIRIKRSTGTTAPSSLKFGELGVTLSGGGTQGNSGDRLFVGDNSAEAFGDYIAGPSHVLPTNGNALFSSPLSSLDFIKYSSFTSISKEGMKKLSKNVEIIAESEGLYEHSNSVKVRKNK